MAMTVLEVFELTMDIFRERELTGLLNPTNTDEYKVLTPGILNIFQAELLKNSDIYSTLELSRSPLTNLLGFISHFDIQEHGTTYPAIDLICEATSLATAYYFEVDGEATVYVEDFNGTWNTLATINVPDTVTKFTAYKGIVTPSAGATKSRLRFSGTYFYRTINRALFGIPLKTSQVPDYAPWVKISMPSDFKSVDQVVTEYPDRQYAKEANSKWEQNKDYYVNYFYNGKIRIVYKPVPVKLTAMTDAIQVDDVTARTLLPYGLAAELAKEENEEFYEHFMNRYKELKMQSMMKAPVSEQAIVDVYGAAYGGGN
jgi:hypothetical protein